MASDPRKKRRILSISEELAEQARVAEFNKAIFRKLLDESQDG